MKKLLSLSLLIALSSWGLRAQDAGTTPTTPPTVTDDDSGAGKGPATTPPGLANRPEHPDHPANPNKPALPDDVKKLIDASKQARETFLSEQKDLIAKLKSATQDERAKIREDLAKNREDFLAQQKELREQIHDRLKEIRAEFKDNRDKVIDQARNNGKSRRPGAGD
jgi:hypothetical protein